MLLSRVANWFQDRFIAFAWLAAPYIAPSAEPFDYDKVIAVQRKMTGSDVSGYYSFFVKPEAHAIAEENVRLPF